MSVLLDTNAFIWLADDKKANSIGRTARRIIDGADTVYVSAISIAEIRIKMMLGNLKFVADIQAPAVQHGLSLLDFTTDHADAITEFQSLTRHDPFDRMLLAQASVDRLTLLTADRMLLDLHLPFVQDVGL